MAEVVRYVHPSSTSGGDGTTNATTGANRAYPSLSAWNTAEATNLVTDGDRHTCICVGGALTDNVTLSGWTTNDSANYIRITVEESSRHDGTPQSGFYITDWRPFGGIITYSNVGTIIEYLDIENTSISGSGIENNTATGENIINNCIVKGAEGAIYQNCSNEGLVANTIAYDSPIGIRTNNWRSNNVYNCLAVDCTTGFTRRGTSGSSKAVLKNNVAFGCTTDYSTPLSSYFNTTDSDYNASDDSTAADIPGGNSVVSLTSGDFTDSANDDWSPASGSDLIAAGDDLTTDFGAYDRTGYTMSETDMLDTTRPVSWGIGPIEAVASGIELAGDAAVVASATGALTTAIQLVGAASAVATATGDLTTAGAGAELAGAASAVATATGDLTTAIQLMGDAAATSTATGDLTTASAGAELAGTAAAVATATGALTTAIQLVGDAVVTASATGDLTTASAGAELAGDAVVTSTATGNLTTAIQLAGNAFAIATATGNIVEAVVRNVRDIAYIPSPVPYDVQYIPRYLSDELYKISAILQIITDGYINEVNAEPERPRTGDVTLADGTNWNPGSGQGVYCYYNDTWNKL